MDRRVMLPLMYWNMWRKSYHEGRVTYHKSMQEFYEGQLGLMEEWSKLVMKLVESSMNISMMKYLEQIMPKPIVPSGIAFGFNPGQFSSSWFGGEKEMDKGK